MIGREKAPNFMWGNNSLLSKLKESAVLKDSALVLGWIAGLILIAGLCWFFIQPHRNRLIQRAVNRVLEQSGYAYRLGGAVYPRVLKTGYGTLFEAVGLSENEAFSEELFFVFTIIAEGYFFPCAALIGSEGKIQRFIPLGSHAEKMMKRVSPGVLQIYTRRIEGLEL